MALLVICAAIGRFGARKLKQSPVLGELAVGIIVGAIIISRQPGVIIIRDSELIQKTAESCLIEGNDRETTVRSKLATGLPERCRTAGQVLLRKDFPAYLFLARWIGSSPALEP